MVSPPLSADSALDDVKRQRDQYIDQFRRSGERNPKRLQPVEQRLRELASARSGEAALRARLELATVVRLSERYAEAAALYQEVALEAQRTEHRDIAFEAWIGMARAHSYGTRDHGAADQALENAIAAAGSAPARKQLHDIAAFRSQTLAGRGDLDAALVSALEAMMRAEEPADRFYAELDAASILLNFAESCDYQALVDARTSDDPSTDAWGACRRAVDAANGGFARAGNTARGLGWAALADQAQTFQRDLKMRLFLINQRAGADRMSEGTVFAPTQAADVLVNQNFSAGGAALGVALKPLIDQAVADEARDPRSLYLRGIAANMRNDSAAALKLFRQAAEGLATERKGLFDARRRGTVIENRAEIMRDLGLSLLAAGDQKDAFDTFEAFRSRGLSELAAALAQPQLSDADRAWLSALIGLEAQASARQVRIRERVLATGALTLSAAELEALQKDERARRELLAERRGAERFAQAAYRPAALSDLQRAAAGSETPVLLYWTTPTNVLVWVVAPGVSEVRTVFLPEAVLRDRVRRVATTSRQPNPGGIDQQAARQLFLYLVAPFERWLSTPRFMIIPQGPLVDLPFEALIDPRSGEYLVQKWVTSYAPSATLAARILSSSPRIGKSVRIIADESLNAITGEADSVQALKRLKVEVLPDRVLEPSGLTKAIAGAEVVHVLAHGELDTYDPLLASLRLSDKRRLTAAQLIAAPWRGVRLAVLSSCDSGAWTRRISNEVYGFPWALMVGGADNAIVSRWRVDGTSNAQWMADFYRELGNDASPAAAAAAASRAMIGRGERHPYRWAAMRVIGR